MLDILKDCCSWFLLSLIENHLNEPIIYYNFLFLIEKSLWNLSSLLDNLTYRFRICFYSWTHFLSSSLNFFRWLACKSRLSRFSMLINYMWSYNLFSVSGFSGSRFFRVWGQGLGPGFRISPTLVRIFSYVEEEKIRK